jgi:hypothetical protein
MTKGGHRVVACRWRRAAVAVVEAVVAFVMAKAVVVEAARIHCRYARWCVERCADSKKTQLELSLWLERLGGGDGGEGPEEVLFIAGWAILTRQTRVVERVLC